VKVILRLEQLINRNKGVHINTATAIGSDAYEDLLQVFVFFRLIVFCFVFKLFLTAFWQANLALRYQLGELAHNSARGDQAALKSRFR
jgi:hypothetical protein